jgi:hypothetical protein
VVVNAATITTVALRHIADAGDVVGAEPAA